MTTLNTISNLTGADRTAGQVKSAVTNLHTVVAETCTTLSSVAGVDAITATASPTPAAYVTGHRFAFVSAGANTGAVTINISSLGAQAIKKDGTTALTAGDIPSGAVVLIQYDGTNFQIVGGASASAHIADTTDAHAASAITNTPAGSIAATDVQAAINELDTEKEPANANIQTHIASMSNPHSVTAAQTGGVTAAGIAGGQTVNGGTAASQTLTLKGTSHATAGYVLINPSGGNVAIGIAAPAGTCHSHTSTGTNNNYLTTSGAVGTRSTLWLGTNYAGAGRYGFIKQDYDLNAIVISAASSGTTNHMVINTSGHLTPGTDKVQDWGSSALRWLAGYFSSLVINNDADAVAATFERSGTTVTTSIADFKSDVGGAGTTVCSILADGDLENTNNSYGALSDIKLKTNIVDATPKLAKLLQVKIRSFELLSQPGFKQIGVVAQELEQVFPGLVKDIPDTVLQPDMTWIPKPAVTEMQTYERHATQKVERIRQEVTVINGQAVLTNITETVDEPLYDSYPVVDESGNPVIVDGVQAYHYVPVMKTVTEEVVVTPAQTEADRPMIEVPTGTSTKTVKYSVFVPMLIKAIQEQQAQIDALTSRVVALGG